MRDGAKNAALGRERRGGVRSGTRRRRGSLGRSDVVVGCPPVGFCVLHFFTFKRAIFHAIVALNAYTFATPFEKTAALAFTSGDRAQRGVFFATSRRVFFSTT
jgi:hypothetical protein